MKDFIKSLKRPGNEILIESILKGYDVIFESKTKLKLSDKVVQDNAKKQQSLNESARNPGKKLSEHLRYQYSKSVVIYRARDTKDNTFNTEDYVTLSPKFAVEHAESNHIYEGKPQQVIKAVVHPSLVADASNPGEYFYIGKPIEGKSVYVSKGYEYDGEIPNLMEAIGPVYHGTNDKFEKFDLDKTTMGDIWFSSNKEIIERGDSGARGTKYIMERYLNIPEEKLAGWNLYEKRGLCELRNMGYRGVKLPSEEGIDYIVFNPKDIIKKPKNIMEAIGPVYHGSPNKFDKFSYDYMGKIGTSEGYGFYFTTDKEIAYKYAEGSGNLYTAYLDINKPLNPTKKTITKTQLVKFIKALDPTGQDYLSNWGDVEHEGYNNTLRKAVDTEYKYNNNDVDLISSIINADGSGPENVYSILTKTLGYDGIVAQPDWVGGGHKIVIPFSPDQIQLVK